MRELVYILPIDFQVLSSDSVSQDCLCTDGFGGLYAAGTGRIEEAVLPFRGVGCKRRLRPPVFLFKIVPLHLSARDFEVDLDAHTCMLVFCAPRYRISW